MIFIYHRESKGEEMSEGEVKEIELVWKSIEGKKTFEEVRGGGRRNVWLVFKWWWWNRSWEEGGDKRSLIAGLATPCPCGSTKHKCPVSRQPEATLTILITIILITSDAAITIIIGDFIVGAK